MLFNKVLGENEKMCLLFLLKKPEALFGPPSKFIPKDVILSVAIINKILFSIISCFWLLFIYIKSLIFYINLPKFYYLF